MYVRTFLQQQVTGICLTTYNVIVLLLHTRIHRCGTLCFLFFFLNLFLSASALVMTETTGWCRCHNSAIYDNSTKSGQIHLETLVCCISVVFLLVSFTDPLHFVPQVSGQHSLYGQRSIEERVLQVLNQPLYLWVPMSFKQSSICIRILLWISKTASMFSWLLI